MGGSDLISLFCQQAEVIGCDQQFAQSLIAIVIEVQKLPLEDNQEGALQRILRTWRDESAPILQAPGDVSADQWADRQNQYARLRQLYLCRHSLEPPTQSGSGAEQQHRTRLRLLSDMLAGTTLLHICRQPDALLGDRSDALREEFAQYLPLELNSRLLQLRPQL